MMDEVEHVIELYPSQADLYEWEPGEGRDFGMCGLLSAGTGSGKTTGAAHKVAKECMLIDAWDPESGAEQPICAVIASTGKALESSVVPKLKAAFPKNAIKDQKKSPEWFWILRNGVKVIFRTLDGDVDSFTADIVWVDECTHPQALRPWTWASIRERLRGPGRKRLIVSGIAHNYAIVRERFEVPDDPAVGIFMPGIRETKGPEEIEWILRGIPKANVEAVLNGGFLPQSERIYLLHEANRYDGPVDRSLPCHIGLDPGDRACALVAQRHGDTLRVVDEFHGVMKDPRDIVAALKLDGWVNIETAAIDAQRALSDEKMLREALPNVHVIRQRRGSEAWHVEEGITRVQWALADGHGTPHLQIAGYLYDTPRDSDRGLIKAITNYRRKPNGQPYRDNLTDHVLDCMRYLVVGHLKVDMAKPRPKRRVRVIQAR